MDIEPSPSSIVKVNSIELMYDTFGKVEQPPVLLIMGLGGQLIDWREGFCAQIAAHGYWVIRFDNRDIGLSTKFDDAGVPDIPELLRGLLEGESIQAAYTLDDMMDDAVGLLDALGIDEAHVIGISMGGMIAQLMAIHHSQRVISLTSIMSTTGEQDLAPPTQEALGVLLKPAPNDREAYIENSVENWRILSANQSSLDETPIREHAARRFERGIHPPGVARQLSAVLASHGRREALKQINVPSLVIHGDADPLVPLEGGLDTARSIPNAELLILAGLGHDMPPELWPMLVNAISDHAARSSMGRSD